MKGLCVIQMWKSSLEIFRASNIKDTFDFILLLKHQIFMNLYTCSFIFQIPCSLSENQIFFHKIIVNFNTHFKNILVFFSPDVLKIIRLARDFYFSYDHLFLNPICTKYNPIQLSKRSVYFFPEPMYSF